MIKRFSHTALDAFATCPKQFAFRYIEKPAVSRRVTANLYMGNAIHLALRQLYDAAMYGRVLGLERVVEIYDSEWEKPEKKHIAVIKENLAVDDYIETGRQMLRKYYERYHPFDQGTTLGAEVNLSFRLPGTSYSFSAKIDRLWKKPSGVIEISDYKTGQHLSQGGQDPRFRQQMGIYQLAVEQSFDGQFEQIEQAQYFLAHDEVVRHHMTADDLGVFRVELKNRVGEILSAARCEDFPTKEGGFCDYCDYFSLCPAKRHRLILDREAGESADEERTTAEQAADLAEKYLQLDLDLKILKEEHTALKADLAQAARDLAVDKLSSVSGEVSVKSRAKEKFIARGADPEAWADLAHVVRKLGLDDYLEPNTAALMKDVYKRDLLSPEQKSELARFVIEKEETTIRVKRRDIEENNDA